LRVSKCLSFVFKYLSKFSATFLGKIATGRLGGLGRSLKCVPEVPDRRSG
jgi:hypothetical protein